MSNNAPGLWKVLPTYDSHELLKKICYAIGLGDNDHTNFHTTLAFDNTNPDTGDVIRPSAVYGATITGFDLFGENNDMLVATLESPELEARHKELHAAGLRKWKWPEYKPHITLIKRNATEAHVECLSQMFPNPIPVSFTAEHSEYAR